MRTQLPQCSAPDDSAVMQRFLGSTASVHARKRMARAPFRESQSLQSFLGKELARLAAAREKNFSAKRRFHRACMYISTMLNIGRQRRLSIIPDVTRDALTSLQACTIVSCEPMNLVLELASASLS